MTLLSRVVGRLTGLPPATAQPAVHRALKIPMPDGVTLIADRWYPDHPNGHAAPIVLSRSPYGRWDIEGRLFAERGFQAVLVSCRGTFGSGGNWVPFRNEQDDGRAVLDWVTKQPWCSGRVALSGASYVGLTQWAVAEDPPPCLVAIAPGITDSNFRNMVNPGGSFALASALSWAYGLATQERSLPVRLASLARGRRQLDAGYASLPLHTADQVAIGHTIEWLQDWLAHDAPDDPWWEPINFGKDRSAVPPTSMVAGWYDLFLPGQLDDFRALRAAGRPGRITIGPWTHGSPRNVAAILRDTLDWTTIHLLDEPTDGHDGDVRVFVLGAGRWVDLPDWPPRATRTRWHLHGGGRLSPTAPPPSPPDRYRYDPADPTPSVGGASLDGRHAGPKDNRRREARADVLTYTTEPLADDVTVMGAITAHIHMSSSLDHTDLVTRLCDVSPRGRSINVSDGIVRLRPQDIDRQPDGTFGITIPMFPTAATFRRGHRIRLQVSSGAHPLYARNPGSGEPLGKATTLVPADQQIHHDPQRPSGVDLPIVSAPIRPRGRRWR